MMIKRYSQFALIPGLGIAAAISPIRHFLYEAYQAVYPVDENGDCDLNSIIYPVDVEFDVPPL